MDERSGLPESEARDLMAQALGETPVEEPAETPEVPGFTIDGVIGRGGMGIVYLGTQLATQSTVAIKIFNPVSSDPLATERFLREGETLDRLDHPNLLRSIARGVLSDGTPYLALEYAEGGTVEDQIRRGEPFDDATIQRWILELCAGLGLMHEAGLIHRDVKPSNLLLDSAGRLVLGDFGLAKAFDFEQTELTLSGTAVGTASYMAPEQAIPDGTIDSRVDVFAIGVVLYQLLTGELPKGHFRPPSGHGRRAAWDRIVYGCLASDPNERFQNASVLAEQIRRLRYTTTKRRYFLPATALAVAAIGYLVFQSTLAQSGWTDLLSSFAPQAPWSRESQGSLHCELAERGEFLFQDFEPGDAYEIRFNVKRIRGRGGMALFLPTAQGHVGLEIGTEPNIIGFQAVGGVRLREPDRFGVEWPIEDGVPIEVHLRVTADALWFSINSKRELSVPITDHELRRMLYWRIPPSTDGIGIGVSQAEVRFDVLEVRSITP